ncbi:T6SS immunity protein Tli3 family protein, partial [Caballeronia glathei]
LLVIGISVLTLSACVSDEGRSRYSQPIPHYDVPAQVIYRIDDHRYVSFENYSDCFHGDAFYIDTRLGIRTDLGREGVENFQGKLINADPSGRDLVFPMAAPPHTACSDRSCSTPLIYSTDSGRTFHGMVYMKTFNPFNRSKDYTMAANGDRLYVAEKIQDDAYVIEYPLVQGIDLTKPYPLGVRGSSFTASRRPTYLSGLRSPSGQDRFTCDASIRPSNPPRPQ